MLSATKKSYEHIVSIDAALLFIEDYQNAEKRKRTLKLTDISRVYICDSRMNTIVEVVIVMMLMRQVHGAGYKFTKICEEQCHMVCGDHSVWEMDCL